MNDLISKAKALKAIEAAARLCVADANHNYLMGFQDAAEAVAQVEAEAMTEQPEIVRCKECYHYPNEFADCPLIGWPRNEDDYCSYAERREE